MFFYSGRQAVVASPGSLSGNRILLVEKSSLNRRLFTEVFLDLGALVESAANGPEAVRIAASGRPFDVMVIDGGLPEGAGLCDDLCTISPGDTKPIVVLYTESVRRYQLRHGRIPLSVDAFVVRDATGKGLGEKVRQLLQKCTRVQPGHPASIELQGSSVFPNAG